MCDVPSFSEVTRDPLGTMIDPLDVLGRRAGKKAAKAQGDIAMAQLEQQREDRDLALKYAEPTPDELNQIQRGITLNENDIARKEKLLASSDPALIEAGSQALKLLRGEEAKTIAPLKANIAKQESALRERLQAQLGPGYENTTAGIQALQAFNEQANAAVTGAQQSSLAQLLGVAQDTSGRYGMQSNIANTAGLAGLFGNISNRQVSAINQTPITGAGAQFIGDLQNARTSQQATGRAIQIGGIASGLGGLFPGGTPGANPQWNPEQKANYSALSAQPQSPYTGY